MEKMAILTLMLKLGMFTKKKAETGIKLVISEVLKVFKVNVDKMELKALKVFKGQKATKVNKVFKDAMAVKESKDQQDVMAVTELQDVTDVMAEMDKMY